MQNICPHCEKVAELTPVKETETIAVKDKSYHIDVDLLKCDLCGGIHKSPKSKDPLEEAFSKYRADKGLVRPDEMKAFRQHLNLTQAELSRLLGWGSVTLSRYERGALQDDTHDKAMKLAMTGKGLLGLVECDSTILSPEKKEKIKKMLAAEIDLSFEKVFSTWFDNTTPDEFNGYLAYDNTKFQNAVAFFCKRGTSRTKLNKLLFYSDFLSFKERIRSITGTKYIHLPHGPVPNDFDFSYSNMCREGILEIKEVPYNEHVIEILASKSEPDMSVFSDDEKVILDFVEEKFKSKNAAEISDLSHQEKAYLETETSELISYSYAKDLSLSLNTD